MNRLVDRFYNANKEGAHNVPKAALLATDTPSPAEFISPQEYFAANAGSSDGPSGSEDRFLAVYGSLLEALLVLRSISFKEQSLSAGSSGNAATGNGNARAGNTSAGSNNMSLSGVSSGSSSKGNSAGTAHSSSSNVDGHSTLSNRALSSRALMINENSASSAGLERVERGLSSAVSGTGALQLFPRSFKEMTKSRELYKSSYLAKGRTVPSNNAKGNSVSQMPLSDSLKHIVGLVNESDRTAEYEYGCYVRFLQQLELCSDKFVGFKKTLVSKIQELNAAQENSPRNAEEEQRFQQYLDDISALDRHLGELRQSIASSNAVLQRLDQQLDEDQRTRRLHQTKQMRRHKAVLKALGYTVLVVMLMGLVRALFGYFQAKRQDALGHKETWMSLYT